MIPTSDKTVEDGNGNVVETVVDHGDGTGTRTTYDASGQVTSTEALTGLPIPTTPAPDATQVVLAKVQVARQEMASYSPTNGARQAVEALAEAVETLVQGG